MTQEDFERAIKVLQKHIQELIAENKRLKQEPISVSVSEKEPDEISEEVTLRFFRNTLKVRWQDMVIYNVEWLKKNWQMEMDIVCGVKPCDDVVSRQAVLKQLRGCLTGGETEYQYVKLHIDSIPPVRPQEQKTGHWIHREDMDYLDKNKVMHKHFMCQDCGFIHDFIDGHTAQYKYCPNCGARMVEPRERSDKE